jgi:hypothetical protein
MAGNPYLKTYQPIKDIDQFFSYDPQQKSLTFNGTSLVVYAPKRYEVYNLLKLADNVTTLGVVDLIINDTYQAGLLLLTTIEMEPDTVSTVMVDEIQYIKMTLSQGSKFICNTERIADASIVYSCWVEFIARGKLPYFIKYDELATLFDTTKSICDQALNVDHVILEVIYSHLARDPDNMSIQYRLTDMKEAFKFISLRNVGYATTSSTSRLLGSYFQNALNSSLIQTTSDHSEIEDLLRS